MPFELILSADPPTFTPLTSTFHVRPPITDIRDTPAVHWLKNNFCQVSFNHQIQSHMIITSYIPLPSIKKHLARLIKEQHYFINVEANGEHYQVHIGSLLYNVEPSLSFFLWVSDLNTLITPKNMNPVIRKYQKFIPSHIFVTKFNLFTLWNQHSAQLSLTDNGNAATELNGQNQCYMSCRICIFL